MKQSLRETYDAVPYPATPYPQTHPGRMAAVGTLFGMNPAVPDHSAVLEIGCADASNLLPLAALYPNSHFTGIDLSERQIAKGQNLARELGLRNLTLLAEDFTEITFINGPFDYIIAHGVYSWVPPFVGERLLQLFSEHLAPQGIGYLSYNTNPGWQVRATLRELIHGRYRDKAIAVESLADIQQYLKGLRAAAAAMNGSYPPLIVQAIDAMLSHEGDYWFHDLLEVEQHPVSFQELVSRLKSHELQYLGEAEVHAMFGRGLPAGVLAQLQPLATNRVELEQLMDVMIYRSFRQSLICRAESTLASVLQVERLRDLAITAQLTEIPTQQTSATLGAFRTHRGLTITQRSAAMATALRHLISEFPSSMTGGALWELVKGIDEQEPAFVAGLAQLFTYDAIDVQKGCVPIAPRATEYPRAFSLARAQSRSTDLVTTLRHEQIRLNEDERKVLAHLDGTVGQAELQTRLAGTVAFEKVGGVLEQLAKLALLSS